MVIAFFKKHQFSRPISIVSDKLYTSSRSCHKHDHLEFFLSPAIELAGISKKLTGT